MMLIAQSAPQRWSLRDTRRAYGSLLAPRLADLDGVWSGRFVGRPRLRCLTVAISAVTPLRGWCGKRIVASGRVTNLVRRHGATCASITAVAAPGTSLLDGREAVIVDYSTAPVPVRWVRGELRWLIKGEEILGILVFPIGRHSLGPLPFVLTPADDLPFTSASTTRG